MVATAYSFGPTAVLLGVSGGWCAWRQGDRQAVKWFLIGFVAGGLATLCYLLIFGDLIGYFAFHVAESQADYATYIFFSCRRFFAALVPREEPQDLVQALAVLCTVGALCLFVALDIYQRRPWRQNAGAILLGIAEVVLLNARGDVGFKNGSFVIAAVLLATLALAHLLSLLPPRTACWASVGILALIALTEWRLRPATFTPYDLDGATVAKLGRWRSSGPSDAAPFVRIRQLVRPEERILILVYQPGAYVAADRLPLSGFYTYFPWDADYARSPWFNRPRDLCVTLAHSPPPVIVYDDWHVWGFDPHAYMPCLFDVLRTSYAAPEAWPGLGEIYIRQDRLKPGVE